MSPGNARNVIQFPETVQVEWDIAAEAVKAEARLRERIARDTLVEAELTKLRVRYEASQIHQQEIDAESTPTLEMMTLTQYKNNPAAMPVSLIDGVLNDNSVCIMLGPSGSGKSTLGLQVCHSLMTGTPWLGNATKKLDGAVGILSYDMPGNMVLDWMEGFPGINPDEICVVDAHRRGNPVGVPQFRAQIAAAWRAMKVHTVVLDSFSASFFGNDQNDAAATMSHYRDMKMFALTEVGARNLIIIVHSKKSDPGSARGSSVHHDVADSIISVAVTGPSPTDPRKVTMEKYRAARGQVMASPVIIGAPDNVTHLVDVDTGAMSLAGLDIPVSIADRFPELPTPTSEPVADTDSEAGDDDL